MIAIIDYGAGNLRSIQRALEGAGARVVITDQPAGIESAGAVVLPGVGHAGHAMGQLDRLGMSDAIRAVVAKGTPFLGVCVGMQVLFDHQDEGDRDGLGLLRGRVRRITGATKVPHMGWSESVVTNPAVGEPGSHLYYYFVHSYIAEAGDRDDVAAEATYGERFPSIVIRDNVWGTQFHPEKSGEAGLTLLRRWVGQAGAAAR